MTYYLEIVDQYSDDTSTVDLGFSNIEEYLSSLNVRLSTQTAREFAVMKYFSNQGYLVAKLTQTSLKRYGKNPITGSVHDQPASNIQENHRFDIVRRYLHWVYGDDFDEITTVGIPDLLVYELADAENIYSILDSLNEITIDEDENSYLITLKCRCSAVPYHHLIDELFYVEVKRENGQLRDTQKQWIENQDTFPVKVAYLKEDGEPA